MEDEIVHEDEEQDECFIILHLQLLHDHIV